MGGDAGRSAPGLEAQFREKALCRKRAAQKSAVCATAATTTTPSNAAAASVSMNRRAVAKPASPMNGACGSAFCSRWLERDACTLCFYYLRKEERNVGRMGLSPFFDADCRNTGSFCFCERCGEAVLFRGGVVVLALKFQHTPPPSIERAPRPPAESWIQ